MTALLRVACHPLDWDPSAADALRLVRHDPHPVALLGAWADGSAIIRNFLRADHVGRRAMSARAPARG